MFKEDGNFDIIVILFHIVCNFLCRAMFALLSFYFTQKMDIQVSLYHPNITLKDAKHKAKGMARTSAKGPLPPTTPR